MVSKWIKCKKLCKDLTECLYLFFCRQTKSYTWLLRLKINSRSGSSSFRYLSEWVWVFQRFHLRNPMSPGSLSMDFLRLVVAVLSFAISIFWLELVSIVLPKIFLGKAPSQIFGQILSIDETETVEWGMHCLPIWPWVTIKSVGVHKKGHSEGKIIPCHMICRIILPSEDVSFFLLSTPTGFDEVQLWSVICYPPNLLI